MKVSTSRPLPTLCGGVAGLMFLGLIILFAPGDSPVKAQDEKVSLVGKNFSSAQLDERKESPPRRTIFVAAPNSATDPAQTFTELAVDDGSSESAVGASGGGTVWGINRLTPTNYPATLTGVSILFQSQQGLPSGSSITVLVAANPSGSANINNIAFSQQINATVQTVGGFFLYQVTPVTINSGDFVVGFRATHAAGQLPLAIDRTPPMRRRSYVSQNGTTFTILDDTIPSVAGNLMIRARLQGQQSGCPAASGLNPTSGAPGAQVVITGSNFTGVSSVRFAGGVNATFAVNSDTQIVTNVPVGAATGPITISKPNCPDATTAVFTVPGGCAYSINPTNQSFSASGGNGSVTVNTQGGCAWTAMSNASFITINSGSSGNGSGAVNYTVAANAGVARTGTMTIAGLTFTVNQSGGSCTFTISPTSRSIGAEGGTGSVTVNTQAGCAWTATSNVNWITITAGASGNGPGAVNYSVASNAGNPPRSGTLIIAGRTFTVDQGGCSYTLSASSQTFSSSGGAGSVNVTAVSGCLWTAASNADWITINSGNSGNGNGAVSFTVAANTGAPRLGTITIAGRTFTVAQGSDQPTPYRGLWQGTTDQNLPLRFTVDNNDIVVDVEADVRITYTVPPFGSATCTYRLRGEAPAIINNGQFEVTLTPTNATLGFQTGAQPRVRATFSSASASSGQLTSSTVGLILCGSNLTFGSISVGQKTWNAQKQAQPGCHSATGVSPTSGAPGGQVTMQGSGFTGVNAVRFANNVNATFTVNSDTQITATVPQGAVTGPITISKPNCPDATTAVFTVPGGCAYSINPTSQSFSASGGNGSVTVNTQGGCAWTAMSNASFITINSGSSGNGSGAVNYTVAANSGAARSGTMTIAGQTFTVNQGTSAPANWARLTSGVTNALRSVHFTSESVGYAAGEQATLLRTTNGGATWTPVTNTGVDASRGFTTVRFLDQNVGWAGGASAMARTLDGGANWMAMTLPSLDSMVDNAERRSYFPISTTQAWSGGVGTRSGNTDGFVLLYNLSTNGQLTRGFQAATSDPVRDLHFLDAGNGWVIGDDGLILRVQNGGFGGFQGNTFEHLNGIHMLNAITGWIVGENGSIFRTRNSGSQWTRLTSGTTARLRDVHFVDGNTGWAVGDGGLILATTNGGDTWTPETSGATEDLHSVYFVNANTGYAVGASGAILKKGGGAVGSLASVSAASFLGAELAVESIVAAFGQNLATTTQVAAGVPLPTELAGTTVKVRDSAGVVRLAGVLNAASVERPAGLFFVAPAQVNYQIPPGTAAGAATVTITSGAGAVSAGTVNIANVAPGLFTANASGQGVAAAVVFRRRADGSESFEPVSQFDQAQGRFVPVPIDLGPESDQVFLILYGSGFRFRSSLSAMAVAIGGVNSEVLFAGDAPGFVGLDQCNVRLSRSLIGRGEVDVVLTVDGETANTVRISIR